MIKYGEVAPSPPLAEAVVDLDAIAHNTRLLAGHTDSPMLAVVKADAFGHGFEAVTRTVLAAGATWLGVTSRAEALATRAAGFTAPILSWLHAPDEDFAPVVAADIDLSAASTEHLTGIAAGARRAGSPAKVHLKVDTGLSRSGATDRHWPELVELARSLEVAGLLTVRGVWSHLANGEHPEHPSIAAQLHAFHRALRLARDAGLTPTLVHLANSAALVGIPEAHFDLVRPGIALYGPEPVPERTIGLRAAMTLRTRVILVKRVAAGTGVSYGHDYTTTDETTLALVPIGFADGVPRCAGSQAEVWIRGRRCPIAGRVAMDQFVVDVGDLPVRTGDEVLVFGDGGRGEPTVDDWARWAGTNPHEIFTGIGARVSRRYLPVRSRHTTEREHVNA
ncbi:alanine racemase [Micromonospora polyrhachis]|uniref:Alanine racemase n=1 Tax=Micromonospora polyrhachis TaxID=1282883 RepID=A0A7W7SLI7_9ACTN|nr:alanine racemase [Micromonospora polyrhachis]MBB4956871.1 alanine racemase [Micromonospora polyrhachis]